MARCQAGPLPSPVVMGTTWEVLAWYPVAAVDEGLSRRDGHFSEGAVVRLAPTAKPGIEVVVWIRHNGSLGSFTVTSTDESSLSVRTTHEKGVGIGDAELVAKEYLEGFKPPEDLTVERDRAERIAELAQFRSMAEPDSPVGRQLKAISRDGPRWRIGPAHSPNRP